MAAPRVVVVGSVNIDLTLRCLRLPAPGETVAGGAFASVGGGKGANQAVAAARLGAAVSFIGCVGDDAFAEQALHGLRAEGIDCSRLQSMTGSATGIALVLVDRRGENCIAVASGANALLSAAQIDAAAATIAAARWLVCQLETPLPAVQRALHIAAAAGVAVLLNPAPAQALPDELLRQVNLLVPNASEAALLAGCPVTDAASAIVAAQRLRQRGARAVVVTLGARGAVIVDQLGAEHCPALPAEVVDTTGAGDCFCGALAVAQAEGRSLRDAVRLAQSAAARSVSVPGAQASMPRREQLAWA